MEVSELSDKLSKFVEETYEALKETYDGYHFCEEERLVIYQSGYLTIKGYDKDFGLYRLGFPNREVKQGFLKFLMPYYANTVQGKSSINECEPRR